MTRRARPPARATSTRKRPRRRWALFAAAMALVAAFVVAGSYPGVGFLRDARERARPNVLLITIDTLRWDHVGAYGARDAATPVIDGLAARGAKFDTAIMHTPLTAPSHGSILTGVTPLRHGVRDNGAFVLPAHLESLPASLERDGYDTAAFVSGFPLDRRFGFGNGFKTYDDRLPRGHRVGGATERKADVTTNAVLEWLDARTAETPWFLWVHYFDPHAPYEPPADLLPRFASRPYDGEIAFVDREIGRLFTRLRDRQMFDGSVVLITADHGESLGEHDEETHGVFVYDATVRVPFILAGPGVTKGTFGHLARGVDVMPTLLDFAGVTIPPGIDGRSLRPALTGSAMPDEPAYIESLMAQRHLGWAAVQGLREPRWKFVQLPRPELYDLQDDPGETRNRAPTDAARAETMARHLQAQLVDTRTVTSVAAPDRDAGDRLRALGYLGGGGAATRVTSSRDPKDGIALINRLEHAIAAIQTDPRKAVDELRAVLREDEHSELARRQLAVALSASGDPSGAAEEIRTLQRAGSATAEDLLLLGESLRVQGQADAARRAIDDAARIDPRSPEVALTQARLRAAEGNVEGAASAYKDALALSPDHPEALVGMANLALAHGDTASAAAFFERVLARDPSDVEARAGLGLVRGRQGRMADAIALLEPVVREVPNHAEALAGLGAALARTGQPAEAVPYFQRAVAAGLRTPAVLNGLGFSRLESGDRVGALDALRSSLEIQPDQPRVHALVGELAAQAGSRKAP